MTQSITKRLAEEIVNACPQESSAAINAAKNGILDYLASSFAGRKDPGVRKLLKIIDLEGGSGLVPMIGQDRRATMEQAALVNGFLGHALDYDDVHSDVRGHPSSVILPTLMSIAATEQVSGSRFLQAYIIGVETMARLGLVIGKQHYLKGWHNTCTLGTIAGAVAGGYLKGYSVSEMARTIGFAATQASGLRSQFGTETKPLHAGLAAKHAVFAVQLVASEFNGTDQAFDGELGFLSVYGEGSARAEEILLANWGRAWKISTPGLWFKLYPFCSGAYHAADAALQLAKENMSVDKISGIRIIYPPGGDAALIERQPKTGEQGRFSAEYIVALALLGYPYTLTQFQNQRITEDVSQLMEIIERAYDGTIEASADAVPAGRFTIVEIMTADGERICARADTPKGSPANPLTQAELEAKLVQSVVDDRLADDLFHSIKNLENAPHLKELLSLL